MRRKTYHNQDDALKAEPESNYLYMFNIENESFWAASKYILKFVKETERRKYCVSRFENKYIFYFPGSIWDNKKKLVEYYSKYFDLRKNAVKYEDK